MLNTVFVPGYGNSIGGHWQELWYKETLNSFWVEQRDWDNPNCIEWVEVLNKLIQSIEDPILLICHSLGCSTVAEWSKKYTGNIKGAFLVANPDVEDANLPDAISGYHSHPIENLPFPSLLLASTNDPYSTTDRAKYFANNWGSDLILVGDLGHINANSNIGEWSEGKKKLNRFIESLNI